jgi:hypothetical protein
LSSSFLKEKSEGVVETGLAVRTLVPTGFENKPPDAVLGSDGLNKLEAFAGLELPNRPPVVAALLKSNFWGAGVVVGVVDCGLKIDLGFSSGGGGVVLFISSSLDSDAAGCLAAASSESENPMLNGDLAFSSGFF